jgi:hypothetical protein
MAHRHGRHNVASTDELKRNINGVKSMTCMNRKREVSSRTRVSGISESQEHTSCITGRNVGDEDSIPWAYNTNETQVKESNVDGH